VGFACKWVAFDGEFAYVKEGDKVRTDRRAIVGVPSGHEEAVIQAAEECPAMCIYIEES